MSSPNKYYPVQGSNKFETVSFPMTKAFTVDFGGSAATNTFALETFTKGSVILGFVAKVVEAMETGGAGTVKFGFSGTIMMSTARASGAATLDTIIPVVGPSSNTGSFNQVLTLTADDTFDVILATTVATAGKADVYVHYIPVPNGALSTIDFKSIITT